MIETREVLWVVSGVILENLTMQPNILLIFKSDYSFHSTRTLLPIYFLFIIAITLAEKYSFSSIGEEKSWLSVVLCMVHLECQDVMAGYWSLIDKRQPSYNQFPVHYLEMRWELSQATQRSRDTSLLEKMSWKQSPESRPLQGLAPPQTVQTSLMNWEVILMKYQ